MPALDEKSADQPTIERYTVQKVVGHKPGRGRKSPHNHVYRLRLKGYGPESDLMYRAEEVPQCHEMISAYRSQHGMDPTPRTPQPSNPLVKRKRQDNGRKTKRKKKRTKTRVDTPSANDQVSSTDNMRVQRTSKRRRKANRKYVSNVSGRRKEKRP